MTFDRVVAGIDFDALSTAALRWAARHFAPEAEFVLVHGRLLLGSVARAVTGGALGPVLVVPEPAKA